MSHHSMDSRAGMGLLDSAARVLSAQNAASESKRTGGFIAMSFIS
jgi:hypothetical protein